MTLEAPFTCAICGVRGDSNFLLINNQAYCDTHAGVGMAGARAEVPPWRAAQDSSMFALTSWLRRLDDEARINSGGEHGATFVLLCLSDNGWDVGEGRTSFKPSTFSEPPGLSVVHSLVKTFHGLLDGGFLREFGTHVYDPEKMRHVPQSERPPDVPT